MSLQQLNHLDQLAQRIQVQPAGRAEPLIGFRPCAIGPRHGHSKAPAGGFMQDERVDAADTPLFEDSKTLPPERMKRVSDLCPSQCFVGGLCSSD